MASRDDVVFDADGVSARATAKMAQPAGLFEHAGIGVAQIVALARPARYLAITMRLPGNCVTQLML